MGKDFVFWRDTLCILHRGMTIWKLLPSYKCRNSRIQADRTKEDLCLYLPGMHWEQWRHRPRLQTDGRALHTARSAPGRAAGWEQVESQPCTDRHTGVTDTRRGRQTTRRSNRLIKPNFALCCGSFDSSLLCSPFFANCYTKNMGIDQLKELVEWSFQGILKTFSSQMCPSWILIQHIRTAIDFTAYYSHPPFLCNHLFNDTVLIQPITISWGKAEKVAFVQTTIVVRLLHLGRKIEF